MDETVLAALGGNALMKQESDRSVAEQIRALDTGLVALAEIVRQGFRVVITHGNGPQVGDILIQQEESQKLLPPMPLDVCVAMSQGQIGYLIQQRLQSMLNERGIAKTVITVITQVSVSPDDPAFREQTKPVGPFYSECEVLGLQKKGYVLKKAGRGAKPYRRVVPSPAPLDIIEERPIRDLIECGHIVVACGGGGVPVVRRNGRLQGTGGVIDKDLASALLARSVKADTLLVLTDVEKVALFFGTPQQLDLEKLSLREAKKYLAEGHFAEGSMRPKIQAAIYFLEQGGKRVVIAALDQACQALAGKAGTRIVAESSGPTSHREASTRRR